MKWWEFVLLAAWPSSLGIALLLGWVRGHKAGVEYAKTSHPSPVRLQPGTIVQTAPGVYAQQVKTHETGVMFVDWRER